MVRSSALIGVAVAAVLAVGGIAAPAFADDAPPTPTSVTAAPGANSAKVTWTMPAFTSSSTVSYTATAAPGGATCTTTALTCSITGLSNGAPYTVTVTAQNGVGTSAASAPSSTVIPAIDRTPPSAVSASVTPSRISEAGGSAAVSVRVVDDLSGLNSSGVGVSFMSADYDFTDRFVVPRTSGSANDGIYSGSVPIPGSLSPGRWTLEVWPITDNAGNGTGFILTSAAVQIGTPLPPTGVTATPQGGRKVLVSWTPPTDDGGNIVTQYVVTNAASGQTTTVGAGAGNATIDLGNTPHTTAVSFTVQAVNAGGSSTPSDPSVGVLVPAVAPGAPGMTSVQVGSGTATVVWTAPSTTNGSVLSGYTVTATPGGQTCSTTDLRCTVSGLRNGTPYSFAVTALSDAGAGDAGTIDKTFTPFGAPAPPSTVSVIRSGDADLSVSWDAADPQGSAVTLYTVNVQAPDGSVFTRWAGASERSTELTGLRPNVAYTISVVAANAVGTSAPQAAVGTFAVPDIRRAPSRIAGARVTTRTRTSVRLSWSPANTTGATVASAYQVRYLKSGHLMRTITLPATARSVTLTHLKRKTTYSVQVRARNVAGYGSWSTAARAKTR